MARRIVLSIVFALGCTPREDVVAAEVAQSTPREPTPPPAPPPPSATPPPPSATPPPPSATPPPPRVVVAPPPVIAAAPEPRSPSLLDPMDPCLPRALDASRPRPSATLDRQGLSAELRWAKTRAETCCPRAPGSSQVVVTLAASGAPQSVVVVVPKGSPASLGVCIQKLYGEVRVDPWLGASTVEKSDVSTAGSAATGG